MRISFAQLEVKPGDPFANLARARRQVRKAVEAGSDLILFPEMVLPGYLVADLWERPSFVKETLQAQNELVTLSDKIAIAFGGLAVDENKKNEDGRIRKYNAFYLAQNQKLVPPLNKIYPFSIKALMPNYREFDDSRHFFDARKLALTKGLKLEELLSPHPLILSGKKFLMGGVLCEDGWSGDYDHDPQKILVENGATLLVNLSCSPYTWGKRNKRSRVFCEKAKSLKVPILYCNCVGLQNTGKTVYTFDGDSTLYTPAGKRAFQTPLFQENLHTVQVQAAEKESVEELPETTGGLVDALQYGTSQFLKMTGIERVAIGISGGIDSALAAAIYSQVLLPEQILLVNMPGPYNSQLTRRAAADLASRLGCPTTTVEISSNYNETCRQLNSLELKGPGPLKKLELKASVLENIQARDRSARVLAAIAAAFGGAFTCNANKSELTVGYSTLYGDLSGFLANLGDLWKGQIYDCANEINQRFSPGLIPDSILKVKPSAELSESQNPETGGGDPFYYPYHDALFRTWVEDWNRKSPEEVLSWYASGDLESNLGLEKGLLHQCFTNASDFIEDLERWWKCYAGLGLAKRIQAPPILAFSRRAFGYDHRESQMPVVFSRDYDELKKDLLSGKK